MQTIVTNKLINPDLKTLFDVECNKELHINVRDPDLMLFKSETPLIKPQDKVTIYRCHIPPQFEIDRALSELCSKVLRQRTINIETTDLITEYDKSVCFQDVYNYILCDKLPGNANTQKKIVGKAANYIVANQLLFKIEKVKQGKTYESVPLLVIPEKFEYNIFHMYHTSLLSMHQGLWKMFLTIRSRYYIPNLFIKLCTFIQACHLCQWSKSHQKQRTPHYGYVPKDYTPLEHLAVDIKYMPDGFDGFRFLIMVTCEQTNFVFAIPSKDRMARAISDALIHRVFAVSGPPQYLSVDWDTALTGTVIQILLQSLQCTMQIISPWNHGSSKAERQIQTIGNMITKQLQGTGSTWPLYASVAAYAMNTFASKALQGFSPFELVFVRKPCDLTSVQFKPLSEYPIPLREYVELLMKRAEFICKLQMNWKIEQVSDKRLTNEMYNEVKRFAKGDIVYALAPSVSELKTNRKKFVMDYIGPLAIAKVLDDTHYKLQLITDNQDILPGIWHINRLKPGAELTPEDVARSKIMLHHHLQGSQSQNNALTIIPHDTYHG